MLPHRSFFAVLLLASAALPTIADPAVAVPATSSSGNPPAAVVVVPANRLPPDPSRIPPPAVTPELATVRAEVAQAIRLYDEVRAEQTGRIADLQKNVDAANRLFAEIQLRQDREVAGLRAEIPATKAAFAQANNELGKAITLLKASIDEATASLQKLKDDSARSTASITAGIRVQADQLTTLAAQSKATSEQLAATKAGLVADVNVVRDGLKKREDDITSKMVGVQAKLDAAGSERSQAIAELAKMKADIAATTKGLPETMASLEAFKVDLKEARDLYAGIIAKQNELANLQKGLEGSIGVLARNQNARTSDYNAQSAQLESLKAELALAQGKLDETNQKIGATKSDLAAVDSRLQTIDKTSRSTITGALATAVDTPMAPQGISVCDRLRANDTAAWATAIVRVLPQHVFEEVDARRQLLWAVRAGTSEGFPINQVLSKLGCGEPA